MKLKSKKKKKKKNPDIFAICAVYGLVAVTDCQNWSVNFHIASFLLDDAPMSGGPVEIDRDQITTLIENIQDCTTWEMINILKMSKSSIESHFYELGYVNYFDVWVLHKLIKNKRKNLLDHSST